MKDKIKRQKNFTIIELKFENAPGISDGDCSHYKIKMKDSFLQIIYSIAHHSNLGQIAAPTT